MKKYPPVDPDFYRIDSVLGMSEEEIQEDWEAYCEGLGEFYLDLDNKMTPTEPPPGRLAEEIIRTLLPEETPHAPKDD